MFWIFQIVEIIMGATRRHVFYWLSNCVYFCKEIKGSHKGSHLLSYYLIKRTLIIIIIITSPKLKLVKF
jgi:hypothetical protein